MDRTRYGGDRRLGHAPAVWQALVREAATLLLGRRDLFQTFWRERSRSPLAERDFRIARHAGDGMARVAHLRRTDRALAAPFASDHRRHDRLFPHGGDGYAVQCHVDHRDGLRRGPPTATFGVRRLAAAFTQSSLCNRLNGNASHRSCFVVFYFLYLVYFLNLLYFPPLRLFPRSRRPRKRPSRHNSLRRRRLFLGAIHQALAKRPPPPLSRRNRRLLPHRPALVLPLRPPQPRLLPHLHHRAQLQALPNPRIPAHPTLLVLPPRSPCWPFPMGRNGN